ncbi:MAG TPA: AAA family ATPase, partial [Ktedonobacterales bacterium]
TQEELAAQAGLSRRGIADLELGTRTQPRKETLQLLAEALQLSPQERALLEATARGRATQAPPPPVTPPLHRHTAPPAVPLVGRAQELGLLERHLAEGPPLLLVAGEPGIGKSRLLQAGLEQAEGQSWTVLSGGCHRRSGQEPYAPFIGALTDSLRRQTPAQQRVSLEGCSWLVRLLPELAEGYDLPVPGWTLPPEQERRLMFKAVARYLANVAGAAGTLLVLDDLHWAGADALDLLQFLVSTTPERPLRLLGAYRDTDVVAQEPLTQLAADLARHQQITRVLLAPLNSEEAATLLVSLLPDSEEGSAPLHQQVLERAGGMPFFLISCAQALSSGSLGEAPAGKPGEVPWTVAESIRQRVMGLSETAQSMLGVAAVVGRTAPLSILLGVATRFGKGEEDALEALETCCRVRLLGETEGQEYQFAHDLIREVVLLDLGAARRTLMHRWVTQVLEQQPGGAALEVLAYHYVRSGETEKAINYLERAGDAARSRYAHAEAVELYQQVVTRLDSLGRMKEAAPVREKLGEVFGMLGRYDQALEVMGKAAEFYRETKEAEGELHVLAKMGMTHRWRGTMEDGLRLLQPLLDQLSTLGDTRGTAAFYVALAQLYVGTQQYPELLAAAERAAHIAHALGDDQTFLMAQERRGAALSLLGNMPESYQVLTEEVIPLAEARGDAMTLINAFNNVGVIHNYRGSYSQEQLYIERALKITEHLNDQRLLVFLVYRRGITAFSSGQWKQARAEFERALMLARGGGRFWGKNYASYGLGLLSLAEGDEEAAARYFEEAQQLEQNRSHRVLHWMNWALAERDLLAGQPDAAYSRLVPFLALPSRKSGAILEFLPLLALAHLERGESSEAQALLTQLLSEARENELRPALAEALRVQARLLGEQEQWEEAEKALAESLEICRSMRAPYAEAKTLYVSGQVALRQKAPELARQRMEAAQAILNTLGERLYASRIEQALSQQPSS